MKFFKQDKGWGALASADLPDGRDAFVHFADIEGVGFRALQAGDLVEFDVEQTRQDSFSYRATRARRIGSGPAPTLRRLGDRVVIVDDGTPDTPLTPRRNRIPGNQRDGPGVERS